MSLFFLRLFAPGVPQPGGSKRGFVVKTPTGGHRAVITEDAKRNRDWRASVAHVAAEVMGATEQQPSRGVPLLLCVTFILPRPKSHYRTGKHAGELRPDAPVYHVSKPDATKLLRSTEDALTGIVWADDSAVAAQEVTKVYTSAEHPVCGAQILVQELET